MNVLKRGLAVWLVIMFVETLHGIARGLLLEPILGDFRARQVSVFIGSAMILAITFMFVRWPKGTSVRDFFLVGLSWVVLTIGFEVVLGRWVMDLPWERIASDYNLSAGGFMPLGLLVMLFSPMMLAKVHDEI